MRVYISGPMTGVVENNKATFEERAIQLKKYGHTPVSPIDLDASDRTSKNYQDYIRRDLRELLDCDAISMLEGWERSEGAKIEKQFADAIGLKEVDYAGNEVRGRTILDEASDLIGGDRQATYGHPKIDFTRTAKLISAVLGFEVSPYQVPLIMICVKLSRECNKHKRDNLVDICGYVGTCEMLYE